MVSSADMMHFSGCKGKITIDQCCFSGRQDDPVNVHGTNLRIVDKTGDCSLKLRFMHPQSYGFHVFSQEKINHYFFLLHCNSFQF